MFTNRVDPRFYLHVNRRDSEITLVQHVENAARRTNWHLALCTQRREFALASGDRKVRIFALESTGEVKQQRILQDFSAQVVRCEYATEGQQLACL